MSSAREPVTFKLNTTWTFITSFTSSTKLLGVHIDEMRTWDDQIKHISSKVSNGLRILYLARKLTDNQETLKTIYYSLVQPYFDYCDVVWGDCSKTRADKLQKLQNRAARIITRADYSIRSSDVLNSLEWSNLEERRKRHLLVTMFKIFNNDCPTYLRERFHRTSEIHDYNLRGSNYDLQLPLPKTNFLKRSFSYRGAMAWNQLSNQTREIGDLTSFKLATSLDITFYYVFILFLQWLVSCYYIVFQIITIFTSIISLAYHTN